MTSCEHVLTEQNFTYVNHSLGHTSCIDRFFFTRNVYDFMLESNVLFHALNNNPLTDIKDNRFVSMHKYYL